MRAGDRGRDRTVRSRSPATTGKGGGSVEPSQRRRNGEGRCTTRAGGRSDFPRREATIENGPMLSFLVSVRSSLGRGRTVSGCTYRGERLDCGRWCSSMYPDDPDRAGGGNTRPACASRRQVKRRRAMQEQRDMEGSAENKETVNDRPQQQSRLPRASTSTVRDSRTILWSSPAGKAHMPMKGGQTEPPDKRDKDDLFAGRGPLARRRRRRPVMRPIATERQAAWPARPRSRCGDSRMIAVEPSASIAAPRAAMTRRN